MENFATARAEYEARLARAQEQIAELKTKSTTFVWVRTSTFIVALIGLTLGYGGESLRWFWQILGWLSAVAFLVAIVRHESLRLQMLRHRGDERLFQRLLARLDRNWTQLPEQQLLGEYSDLIFADDLDVAGSASLLSLLNLAGTPPGRRTLQQWLAETPAWPDVCKRQAAVKLLKDRRALRLSIIRTVNASSDGSEDVYGLPNWANSPPWLPQHRLAHGLSYLGPAMVLGGAALLAGAIFGQLPWLVNAGIILLGGGFLINILVTVAWGSWIHDIFQQVTGQHQAVYRFADVFEAFEDLPDDQGLLTDIRRAATESPTSARRGFARLLWNVRLANLQRDPIMYVVYLVLQLLLLWDFRVLRRLEQWKAEFGAEVGNWFAALGTCEALVSCGTLADEYPHWAFPQDTASPDDLLLAEQLGHPLLPDATRVRNDLHLRRQRPLLLVTGSNMAGKSTFMRAVGLNLLLARTGCPVCAERLCAPQYDLATSIRVRDSLRDGVSFFMAELKRLKEVVDMAEHRRPDAPHRILFLLDEILQGTNSRERQIAVASVLGKLLSLGATGLVSTHDLDLATADTIESVSQVVHFREYFETENGREVMRFDYHMRPGSTPTTNALKLLKLVGLHDGDECT